MYLCIYLFIYLFMYAFVFIHPKMASTYSIINLYLFSYVICIILFVKYLLGESSYCGEYDLP